MMRLSLSSDFFRTGATDDDLLPVNQKRKFLGFVLHVYRIFFNVEQFIPANDWLLANWNSNGIDLNFRWTITRAFPVCLNFTEELAFFSSQFAKPDSPRRRTFKWERFPLSIITHEWTMKSRWWIEIATNCFGMRFSFLEHSRSVSDLLIGLKRMRSDLFSRR